MWDRAKAQGYYDVEIDACPKCGGVDGGELQKLVAKTKV
ncbi:MAG: zf-TFIIB domain-containing protein [Pyrobaculum sp.]